MSLPLPPSPHASVPAMPTRTAHLQVPAAAATPTPDSLPQPPADPFEQP
jgi:hypothetical protein